MAGEICTGWTWKRESDKPVVLEVAREVTARSESDKAELIIGNECWLNNGNSRVDVNEGRPAYVYGALHANEDNTGIHIHIEPNANVNHEDLSCKFVCACACVYRERVACIKSLRQVHISALLIIFSPLE